MHFFSAIVALAAMVPSTFAALPTTAEGFAASTTGGKGGSAVYPKTTAELVKYLGDNTARIVYLDRTFNFLGTEGTTTESGCLPWGTGSQCQSAINKDNWCKNYQPNAPTTTVKYDKAGMLGITVGSNKSIIGVGSKGVIKGKGLRIVSGAKNVIVQNIHITDLNPHTVWGGDALTIDNADLVWIDHVTTSLISRQHLVLGEKASNRVSVTNNKFDGNSQWSANCNSYHYWGLYFTGSNDLITFKNNYIYHMSGRAPKVAGNTLLHAVNNYFHDVWDHAFEIESGAQILAEGNVFQNVKNPVKSGYAGRLYSVVNAAAANVCKTALGRACQLNGYGSSGSFDGTDSGFLNNFKGKTIASAGTYNDAKAAQTKSGFGVA